MSGASFASSLGATHFSSLGTRVRTLPCPGSRFVLRSINYVGLRSPDNDRDGPGWERMAIDGIARGPALARFVCFDGLRTDHGDEDGVRRLPIWREEGSEGTDAVRHAGVRHRTPNSVGPTDPGEGLRDVASGPSPCTLATEPSRVERRTHCRPRARTGGESGKELGETSCVTWRTGGGPAGAGHWVRERNVLQGETTKGLRPRRIEEMVLVT